MRYQLFCRIALALGCIALGTALSMAFSAGLGAEAPRRVAPAKHKHQLTASWVAPNPYALRWHDGGWPVWPFTPGAPAMSSDFRSALTPAQVTINWDPKSPYVVDTGGGNWMRLTLTPAAGPRTLTWNPVSPYGPCYYLSEPATNYFDSSWAETYTETGVPSIFRAVWVSQTALRVIIVAGYSPYNQDFNCSGDLTSAVPATGAMTMTDGSNTGRTITISSWQ